MAWEKFNEKHPFGKGATVVSQENYEFALMRRAARNRIEAGVGTPEDRLMLAEAERLIKKAVEE